MDIQKLQEILLSVECRASEANKIIFVVNALERMKESTKVEDENKND